MKSSRTAAPRRNKRPAQKLLLPRVGMGYDIHRFAEGRPLVLGGVTIPSDRGLLGHSDADVVLHAVCDALLGAAGLGDIGTHFPDTDDRYRGISSLRLLAGVAALLKDHGYAVGNVDVMLLLESPKIAPHIPHMLRTTAAALGIPAWDLSIKATTNETLGALGRREGCAAFAVALIVPRS